MKLWLTSPAWGRYAVTRLALAQRRHLCDVLLSRGVEARGVIVGSDDNLDIAQEYGFDTVEFPNDRGLGAKFNAGFQYALDNGADYIIHIGSDDWMHPDFFSSLPIEDVAVGHKPMPVPGTVVVQRAGPVLLGAGGLTCVDLHTSRAFTFDARRIWGTVPWALPRAVMLGGSPWVDPEIDRGVEHSLVINLIERLGPCNWRLQSDHPFLCVDWKVSTNVTPFDRLHEVGHSLDSPYDRLREFYPDHLVDLAVATSKEVGA